jgi:predicted alpha/beta-fold hydrolase
MPVLKSTYRIKGLHSSMHYSTIYNNTVRKVAVSYDKRERLELKDGDFLDLDWKLSQTKTNKVIITLHGLEGSTSSKYMLGMAKYGAEKGFDVVGMNFRGCSGEENRLYRAYHAGATEDLQAVVDCVLSKNKYQEVYIKGYSLGGNLVMLYMGSEIEKPKEIKKAMAVSSPNFLKEACAQQKIYSNTLYAKNFLVTMKKKLKQKQQKFPKILTVDDCKKVKTLTDFDNVYTSKAHGFIDANDYYEKCSSSQVLQKIKIPTLLINAQNDSFLSAKCYPKEAAKENRNFFLETPKHGGHLGFYDGKDMTYTEKRALEFFNETI